MKSALTVLLTISLGSIMLDAQSTNQQSAVSSGGNFKIRVPQGAYWQTEPPASFGVAGMQGLGQQSARTTVNACPVSMRAQHASDGNLMRTQSAHPKGTGQRLHVTLADSNSKQITKATLTVHGVSPKGQLQYAAKGQYPSSETLTLTVPFVANGEGGYSADFWVAGMTAVQLIDLTSIQYRDDSIWKLADGQSCKVQPDLFMLISSR